MVVTALVTALVTAVVTATVAQDNENRAAPGLPQGPPGGAQGAKNTVKIAQHRGK